MTKSKSALFFSQGHIPEILGPLSRSECLIFVAAAFAYTCHDNPHLIERDGPLLIEMALTAAEYQREQRKLKKRKDK